MTSPAHITSSMNLLDPLMADPEVVAILSDQGLVSRMLTFEAGLAEAQGALGVIPAAAAPAIRAACDAETVDMEALAHATAIAGNLAIPLVKMLTAATDEAGRGYVHWGATSQDVLDTALILQFKDCFDVFETRLLRLKAALVTLVQDHRDTPMIGRTLLQHALPTSFGLKAAGWLGAILRQQARLADLRAATLVLQFGGAAGTLASLGTDGIAVGTELARRLGLGCPVLPWHTLRDRVAETACFCGVLTGTLGKIARDISLMTQTDVGEVQEGAAPGRGGSSTMPHKRNPVSCNIILAAATSAPGLVATMLSAQVQDHERALGAWAAEWRTLPELLRITSGALVQCCSLIENLEVNAARMRANLEATGGLVMAEAVMMALAPHLGRMNAHHLVEKASKRAIAEGRHLREILGEDESLAGHLDATALAALFEPTAYLGSSAAFIDAALEAAT